MEPLRADDPARVASYRLLARLGEGGMGVVYLARNRFGRKVAVKVIRESLAADDNYRKRFRREVAAAGTVTGAYTATVIDADSEARNPWLATVYVPGVTLWEAVERFGPLPEPALRALALGMAEALRAIHRCDVIHRDVKPGNVMLTANGPRLIDFGIARPDDATAITRVGRMVGTHRYMSAEQSRGAPTGPATDVYSLGVTLVYAATGQAPFELGRPAQPLDLSGMGEPLAELVRASVHAVPQERPTTDELIERLSGVSLRGTDWLPLPLAAQVQRAGQSPPASREVMGAVTIDGTAETVAARPMPPVVPRRRLLGAAGAALCLLTAGDAPPPGSRGPSQARRTATHRTGTRAWKRALGVDPAVLSSADDVLLAWGHNAVWSLDPDNGEDVWARDDVQGGLAGGKLYVVDTAKLPWTLRQLDPHDGDAAWSFKADPFRAGPQVSGSLLYYATEQRVRAVDTSDGAAAWSKDAKKTAYLVAGDTVLVGAAADSWRPFGLDTSDGKQRWNYDEPFYFPPAFGGSLLFGCGDDGAVHALNPDDGSRVWRMDLGLSYGRVVHHDGTLYAAPLDDELRAVSVDGKRLWHRKIGDAKAERYGVSNRVAAAGELYVCATDGVLHCLEATTGATLWTFDVGERFASPPVLLRGRVYVGTNEGVVHALEAPR